MLMVVDQLLLAELLISVVVAVEVTLDQVLLAVLVDLV